MRERIRGTIETIVEEELEEALGARALGACGRESHRLSAWQARADAEHQPRRDHHI